MHQHFGKVALTSSSSLGIPTSHLFLQVTLDRYLECSLLPPVSFLTSELTQKPDGTYSMYYLPNFPPCSFPICSNNRDLAPKCRDPGCALHKGSYTRDALSPSHLSWSRLQPPGMDTFCIICIIRRKFPTSPSSILASPATSQHIQAVSLRCSLPLIFGSWICSLPPLFSVTQEKFRKKDWSVWLPSRLALKFCCPFLRDNKFLSKIIKWTFLPGPGTLMFKDCMGLRHWHTC